MCIKLKIQFKFNKKIMVCAGIVLINTDSKILLVKNSNGRWSFPKGKKEPEDKSDYYCGVREFREETGLVGFTYKFCSIPYVELKENGAQSCILYIARITVKHSDYGFIEGHKDIDEGDIIEAKFMNLIDILNLTDTEFFERRKIIALNALNEYHIVRLDQIDVMLRDWKKIHISKAMTKLLRHSLDKFKSKDIDGSVLIAEFLDIIQTTESKDTNFEIIKHIIRTCPKQRFQLNDDNTRIRAVQGHSSEGIDDELLATEITIPITGVVHMSFRNLIKKIRTTGLSKMKRQHIHFAERSDSNLLRTKCDLEIEVNMESAMADGIRFFRAENGVIISPGNDKGFIPFEHLIFLFV